jgi:hypothetical protein
MLPTILNVLTVTLNFHWPLAFAYVSCMFLPLLETETCTCLHLSSKVTVSMRYSDLTLTLPSQARVLAWPLRSSKRISTRSSSASATQPTPFRLSYAEEALKTLCLPEGPYTAIQYTQLFAQLVLICFLPPCSVFQLMRTLCWSCPML